MKHKHWRGVSGICAPGAARNGVQRFFERFPDFAALHPGYKIVVLIRRKLLFLLLCGEADFSLDEAGFEMTR